MSQRQCVRPWRFCCDCSLTVAAMTTSDSFDGLLDLNTLNDLRDMLGDSLSEIAVSFLDGLDAEVQRVVATQGTDAMQAAAHSLKGSSGNMGAAQLAAEAAAIEKLAHAADWAQAASRLDSLKTLAAATHQALTRYLASN